MNPRAIVLAIFIAAASAVAVFAQQPALVSAEPENPFKVACERAEICSPADIAMVGAAARMASKGDVGAKAWLDYQFERMGK